MNEVKIDDYISLRRKGNEIKVYIKDRIFDIRDARYLSVEIPTEQAEKYRSIDEFIEETKYKPQSRKDISSEENFQIAVKNVQQWVESKYDISLLYSRIAFPLLTKLADYNLTAEEVLTKEIIKALKEGRSSTIHYFLENNQHQRDLLNSLTKEDLTLIFGFDKFKSELKKYADHYNAEYHYYPFLKNVANLDVLEAVKMLKDIILVKGKDIEMYLFFQENNYFKILTENEIKAISLNHTLQTELDLVRNISPQLKDGFSNKERFMEEIKINLLHPVMPSSSYSNSCFYARNNRIEGLFLKDNNLKNFPKSILQLTGLKYLKIINQEIRIIPEGLAQLKNLRVLILSHLNLEEFPLSICDISTLEELDVSYNKITSIPDAIERLKNLKKFNLRENPLKSIPESMGGLEFLTGLLIGSWNSKKKLPLIKLPESFGKLISLQIMILVGSNIDNLPQSFCNLKSLKILFLQRNNLKALPDRFGDLKNLENLNISYNQLTTLPESFGTLISLKKFSCYNNPFSALPESIKKLPYSLIAQLLEMVLKNGIPLDKNLLNDVIVNDLKSCKIRDALGSLSKIQSLGYSIENIENLIFCQNSNLLNKIRKSLRDKDCKEQYFSYKLFAKLFDIKSKYAKNFLNEEIKTILQNAEVSSYYQISQYLVLFDDQELIKIYKYIPIANIKELEASLLFTLNEEYQELVFFIACLGPIFFPSIINSIKRSPPNIQEKIILNLFSTKGEYCYFDNLNEEHKHKFLEAFDKKLVQRCFIIFLNFLIVKFQETKYNVYEVYCSGLEDALNILIEKNIALWKGNFKNIITKLLPLERLDTLLYLVFTRTYLFDDFSTYFNEYEDQTISDIIFYIIDETNADEFYLKEQHFKYFGEKSVSILLSIIRKTEDWETLESYASIVMNLKKNYGEQVEKEIFCLFESNLSDYVFEFILTHISPYLGDVKKAHLLLNPKYKIIDRINDIDDGEIRYYALLHVINFLIEKGVNLSDPIGKQCIEHVTSFLFLSPLDFGDGMYEIREKFLTSISPEDLVRLVEDKEFNFIEKLNSHFLNQDDWHRWDTISFFYIAYQHLLPEKIIKIHSILPDKLRKEILKAFKHSDVPLEDDEEFDEWTQYASSKRVKWAQKITKIVHILKSNIKIHELNDYLSLHLERGRTFLYVNGIRFNQCMQLALNIPVENIELFEGIESIDEVVDILEKHGEKSFRAETIPEVEAFWGHCSNLQAWIDHDYDTRVLHRSFAFPLLRELTKLGDLKAKKVYKNEIAYRFTHGNFNIVTYLLEQHYLEELSAEELETLFEDFDFTKILQENNERLFLTLKRLGDLGSQIPIQVLKKEVEDIFLKGDIEYIQFIIREKYLELFDKKELDQLLGKFDFSILSKEDARNSLPLLKVLADTGNQRAKDRFSQEIDERIDSGLVEDISFLVDNRYLTPYSQEELKEIFNRINFENIIAAHTYHSLSLLKKLSNLGSVKAAQYLKEKIIHSFLSDNHNDPLTVIQGEYLESFTKEEREDIFNQFDFSIYPDEYIGKKIFFLTSMIDMDISGAKERLIHELIESFSSPHTHFEKLENLFFRQYDRTIDLQKLFTHPELEEIFHNVDYQHIPFKTLKHLTNLSLAKPQEVIRERIAENEDIQDKLDQYKEMIQNELEYGNYKEFYHWFKKNYKPWEKYPHFSNPLVVKKPASKENFTDYSFGILQDDFEVIYRNLTKSKIFKNSFRKALKSEKYPFSIPYKTIALFAENGIKEAQRFFSNEIEYQLKTGSLRIIAFLSRPQYMKFLDNDKKNELFSLSNDYFKTLIVNSLIDIDTIPLALIILKRMAIKGDLQAFSLLQKEVNKLQSLPSSGMHTFLNKDGFTDFINKFLVPKNG